MAYFDFVNSGGGGIDYGLVSQGVRTAIANTQDTEYSGSWTASGDTRYFFNVDVMTTSSYTPYLKISVNGTQIANLTGLSNVTAQTTHFMGADVFVKSGDTISIKLKTYRTGASNNYVWISQ